MIIYYYWVRVSKDIIYYKQEERHKLNLKIQQEQISDLIEVKVHSIKFNSNFYNRNMI